MNNIFLILFVFLIAVFILMILSIWYMNFLLRKFVGDKHKCIEDIISTSEVPECWSKNYNTKIVKLMERREDEYKIANVKKKALNSYLNKLNKLIKYLTVASLVEDENVRSELINELENIKKKWERGVGTGWYQTP